METELSIQSFFEFLFVTVIFRYMVLPWCAKLCAAFIKRCLLKTEEELAIWLHFKNRPVTKRGRLKQRGVKVTEVAID